MDTFKENKKAEFINNIKDFLLDKSNENTIDYMIRSSLYKYGNRRIKTFVKKFDDYSINKFTFNLDKYIDSFVSNSSNISFECDYDKLVFLHIYAYIDRISKELFSNTNFIFMLYENYLNPYITNNAKLVRKTVADHTDLSSIIDPMYTGLMVFFKSKKNKDMEVHFEKITHNILCNKNYHIVDSIEAIFDREFDNTGDYYLSIMKKYAYKIVISKILDICALYIIDNHEEFYELDIIVKDCEMMFTRKCSAFANVSKTFSDISTDIHTKLYATMKEGEEYSIDDVTNVNKEYYMQLIQSYVKETDKSKFLSGFNGGDHIEKPTDFITELKSKNDGKQMLSSEEFMNLFYNSGFMNFIVYKKNETEKVYNKLLNYSISKHYRDMTEVNISYVNFTKNCINYGGLIKW